MTSAEWDSGPILTAQEVLVQGTSGVPNFPTIHLFTTPAGEAVIRFTDVDGVQYDIFTPADTLQIYKVGAATPQLHFTDDLASTEEGIYFHDPVNSVGIVFRQADGFLYRHNNFDYEEWHTIPALQNGWTTTAGPGYQSARYRLGPDGFVTMEGLLIPGVTADGTLLLTMPAGYRPSNSHLIVLASGGPPATSTIQINNDGTCRCFGTGAGGMSLTGVRYAVDELS